MLSNSGAKMDELLDCIEKTYIIVPAKLLANGLVVS